MTSLRFWTYWHYKCQTHCNKLRLIQIGGKRTWFMRSQIAMYLLRNVRARMQSSSISGGVAAAAAARGPPVPTPRAIPPAFLLSFHTSDPGLHVPRNSLVFCSILRVRRLNLTHLSLPLKRKIFISREYSTIEMNMVKYLLGNAIYPHSRY